MTKPTKMTVIEFLSRLMPGQKVEVVDGKIRERVVTATKAEVDGDLFRVTFEGDGRYGCLTVHASYAWTAREQDQHGTFIFAQYGIPMTDDGLEQAHKVIADTVPGPEIYRTVYAQWAKLLKVGP